MGLLRGCVVQCMHSNKGMHACMHACAHTMKSLTRIFLMVPSGKFSLLGTSMGLCSKGPSWAACINPGCHALSSLLGLLALARPLPSGLLLRLLLIVWLHLVCLATPFHSSV